jgi:Fe-S cluster assembly protein SufD
MTASGARIPGRPDGPGLADVAAVPAAPGAASLLALARRHAASRAGKEPEAVTARRRDALARFEAQGLPTVALEDWKYTDVSAIARTRWQEVDPIAVRELTRAAVEAMRLHLHGGISLVFVDGGYAPGLSSLPAIVEGCRVGSLADAMRTDPDVVAAHLGRLAPSAGNPFVALNTAAFSDGAFVHVAKDTCLPVPIEVLHLSTGGFAAAFPRTLIVAEEETRVTVVEHHVALPAAHDTGPSLTVPVTEVVLRRNAAVEHVRRQEEADDAFHVSALFARQERDSRFTAVSLALGAAISRQDTDVVLGAEGAEASLLGLYVVGGDRHADAHTRIDHAAPRGTSRELYKGVLDGRGTGVFNGKVVVRPGAAQTDSRQASHSLLLSPDATADTKPELEIYADDVKCAHGATVGRLRDEEVFYLRSRGIPEAAAKDLLVRAFAREVVERVSIEGLRDRLEKRLDARLGGALPPAGARSAS